MMFDYKISKMNERERQFVFSLCAVYSVKSLQMNENGLFGLLETLID